MGKQDIGVTERILSFGKKRSMVAIITEPPKKTAAIEDNPCGVLLMNAGLVHHVGPNRIYVKLARKLAQSGFYVVRFDFSGIGDSGPRPDKLPAEKSIVADAQEVMDHIAQANIVKNYICIGLCSGAAAAFRTAVEDNRIGKIILINPLVPGTESVFQMQASSYYWKRAIYNPRSWIKLFLIRSSYKNVWNAIKYKAKTFFPGSIRHSESKHVSNEIIENFNTLRKRNVKILFISATEEIGEQYIKEVAHAEYKLMKKSHLLETKRLADTDHMVTPLACQEKLISFIFEWVGTCC